MRPDGTCVVCGDDRFDQCGISEWTDVVSVSCGAMHTVGVRSDGTCVACGDDRCGQCDI